jgi:hypothetical protein
MLSRSELARLINGPALDREITRLGKLGGSWIEVASVLSRRINWTLGWENLGPAGSRFSAVGNRGEAVLFDDRENPKRIVKLRGREENGFGDAGFGCILSRNARGLVAYAPGTMANAIEREQLTWEAFGFACRVLDMLGGEAALLLEQDFIIGEAPSEKEIHAYMVSEGWEWQRESREVSPTLNTYAWRKGNLGAFDANPRNFVRSTQDGKVYPIDLIVWHWPEQS